MTRCSKKYNLIAYLFFFTFLFSINSWPCSMPALPWNKGDFLVTRYDLVKNSQWIAYGKLTEVIPDRNLFGDICPSTDLDVKIKLNKFVKGSYSEKVIETKSYRHGIYEQETIPVGKEMIVIGGKSDVMAFEINNDSDTEYMQKLISAFTKEPKPSFFEIVGSVKDKSVTTLKKCYQETTKDKILKCLKTVPYPKVAYPYVMWSEANPENLEKKYCSPLLQSNDNQLEFFNKTCRSTLKQRIECDYDNYVHKTPFKCSTSL